MTWLTFDSAYAQAQKAIVVSVAKAAAYMGMCLLTTAIMELAILGPPREDSDG